MSFMHHAVPVQAEIQIGEATRQGINLANLAGFTESDRCRVVATVTELATNLFKHSQDGQILLRIRDEGGMKSIEVISIDRGPGIVSLEQELADGDASGKGLAAIRSMVSVFDAYTSIPNGTVIFCLLEPEHAPNTAPASFIWGAINLPAPFETVSGDTWRIKVADDQIALFVIDGLGHGPDAAVAANEGAEVFISNPFAPLSQIFENMHTRLRRTRGGAAAVGHVDRTKGSMKFVGIGNIAGAVKNFGEEKNRGLFSHNGTVGAQMRKVQEFEYGIMTGSLVILHSDGLQSRWSLDKYPGLAHRHPGLIAGVVFRDFCRGRDDLTVLVVRVC